MTSITPDLDRALADLADHEGAICRLRDELRDGAGPDRAATIQERLVVLEPERRRLVDDVRRLRAQRDPWRSQ